ncbi:MAG: ethylbenzene dehydrogenase-related protein, partial [Candidatus Poribacteria bacterium]
MKRFVLPIFTGGFLVMFSLVIIVAYTMGAGENKLEARYTTTPPVVDGDASDAVWADAPELTLQNGATMKTVYTDDEIFILAQWADPTFSATRGGSWSWDGATWVKSSNIEEGAYNEDRFCVFWNINITDFASAGCVTKCHGAQGDATGAWLENVGERGDMWHMKAARALGAISAEQIGDVTIDNHEAIAGTITLNGYTDDKVVTAKDDPDFPFDPEDGGRHGDKYGNSQSMFFHNRNSDKTAPLYIETAPENYIDAMILQQAEIDSGEAVEVAGLSDAQIAEYWAIYEGFGAVVPERVLRAPAGSRGDVRESATWSDGVWTAEYQRKLVTGYDDDVQFDDLTKPYYFATTIMDNSGGENHDLRDTLETLVFEEFKGFVPIGELPKVAGYVGSETCSLCHRDIAERWKKTPHANYVREATPENVVGDFTQSLTLSDAKAGIPPVVVELGVQDGVYTVKTGETIYTVDYAFGGLGWKQRYLTKIDNSMYILPI